MEHTAVIYKRYLGDIMVMYDTTRTDPHTFNEHINQIHDNTKLYPSYENNVNTIFLDLTITC
jgi:hypothetical protein